jgi:NAD(P)-dependent dehydrogenase (short-subunit alcohol dehydrogenase family)
MTFFQYLVFAAVAIVPFAMFLFNRNKHELAASPLTESEVNANLQGKEFLIVGGTKGIGHALMESVARRGARVVITGRTSPENLPQGVTFVKGDVTTLKATHELAGVLAKDHSYDTVVFTVGIFAGRKLKRTAEGIEEDLAISYLSRFIISDVLIKASAISGRKRVFIMGYPGEDMKPTNMDDINFETTEYSMLPAHFNTVIFNEALVYELARRHPDLHVFGLNPGLIRTGIRDNVHGGETGSLIGKVIETLIGLTNPTAEQFTEKTLIPLVASPELDKKTGISFTKHGSIAPVGKWLSDQANTQKVWEESEKLVKKVLG